MLKKDGTVHIVYSASGSWTDDYCLGLLTLTGPDPLDPAAWTKTAAPLFTKAETAYGPGHCSFTTSPDGAEDWIVYHANEVSGSGWRGRSVRAQKFGWDGTTPVFGSRSKPEPNRSWPTDPSSLFCGFRLSKKAENEQSMAQTAVGSSGSVFSRTRASKTRLLSDKWRKHGVFPPFFKSRGRAVGDSGSKVSDGEPPPAGHSCRAACRRVSTCRSRISCFAAPCFFHFLWHDGNETGGPRVIPDGGEVRL